MCSQTPREISLDSVWDLFSCKNVCQSCKLMPEQTQCVQCMNVNHDSNFVNNKLCRLCYLRSGD